MTRALQLIFSLSILVLIHEMGHFLFSRLFKVRVEKFYLFFNPFFSLVRAKKLDGKWQLNWFSRKSPDSFKEKPEVTEFGVGWVPLGGYCSISGMVDESLNTEQMETTRATLGIPFEIGRATSAHHGRRCFVQFPIGIGGVFSCTFHLG